MSVNKATILGHLGADPDIKTAQSGDRVANFSVATSEKWTDKQTGEKKEKTEWHRVVCWQQGLVGVIERYLRKGSKVYIEGKLETRKWTDQNGVEKYTTEIVLNGFGSKLEMLDSRSDSEPQGQYAQAQTQEVNEDDIPF